MPTLSKEVVDFVSACEAIRAKLARGRALTASEKHVIEIAAIDLLSKIKSEYAAEG